jgi:hypothetical protein
MPLFSSGYKGGSYRGTLDDDDDDDDVYLKKLQQKVLQNLWSEYMNNADQPIWYK